MASVSGVLYIGMTGELEGRVKQHKEGKIKGFTAKYRARKLVYYEEHGSALDAIEREKQLKGWRRSKKVKIIESINPTWQDLAWNWYG
jgi:putative endonuclease